MDEGYWWDPNKRLKIKEKHDVDILEAIEILEDPHAIEQGDWDYPERYIRVGQTQTNRVLQVVYETEILEHDRYGEVLMFRIITAFTASDYNRHQYQSEKSNG